MLAIETRPIARLTLKSATRGRIGEIRLRETRGAIAEFGCVNPVLIGVDDVIIAAHGRVLGQPEKLRDRRSASHRACPIFRNPSAGRW